MTILTDIGIFALFFFLMYGFARIFIYDEKYKKEHSVKEEMHSFFIDILKEIGLFLIWGPLTVIASLAVVLGFFMLMGLV